MITMVKEAKHFFFNIIKIYVCLCLRFESIISVKQNRIDRSNEWTEMQKKVQSEFVFW